MTVVSLYRVYLLRCADDTLYCGITKDLERRVSQHNAGKGAKYTRPGSRRPVELLTATEQMSYSEALRLEYRVKQQPRHAKAGFLASHSKKENIMDNASRAVNAEAALQAYLRAKKEPDAPEERETNIQDLVTDLLHLAKQEKVDVESLLRMAKNNFETEVEDEETIIEEQELEEGDDSGPGLR